MPTDLEWLHKIDPLFGDEDLHDIEVADPAWVRAAVAHRRPLSPRLRWVALSAAAAAVAALCLLVTTSSARAPKAGAAVTVSTRGNAFIVTIRQQQATASDLARAFAEHHVDISVRLVPVSPSLVGRYLSTEGPGGADVRSIATPGCPVGDPRCPITLSISDVTGHPAVLVGRAARPGEHYAVGASVFLPGEVLHCSGVLNTTVHQATSYLAHHGLVARFQQEEPTGAATRTPASTTTTAPNTVGQTGASTTSTPATPKGGGPPRSAEHIVDGLALSAHHLVLFVSPEPLSPAQVAKRYGGRCPPRR